MDGANGVFRALGDPTRREILRLLRRRDMTAGEIADRFPQARSTLSEHLRALRESELVVTERQGTTIRYSLNLAVVEDVASSVMELLGVGRTRRTQ
ncbi:MAG: helix-turn-helix transcriptional regulator [Chloroflexota bacterium]|nr:helix-turn-helix domain-containing protein [Chloroflexota bacterium]MDE3101285.1 helix-turn-helix transcriptional regulator [Chloroflexota bacterium]